MNKKFSFDYKFIFKAILRVMTSYCGMRFEDKLKYELRLWMARAIISFKLADTGPFSILKVLQMNINKIDLLILM